MGSIDQASLSTRQRNDAVKALCELFPREDDLSLFISKYFNDHRSQIITSGPTAKVAQDLCDYLQRIDPRRWSRALREALIEAAPLRKDLHAYFADDPEHSRDELQRALASRLAEQWSERRELRKRLAKDGKLDAASEARLAELNQSIGEMLQQQDSESAFLLAQEKLRRYEFVAELGRGGSAKVWSAYDVKSDRMVAIKTLHGYLQASAEARERLRREAQYMMSLSALSDRIVRVYDMHIDDASDGFSYYVMELVEGASNILTVARSGDRKLAFDLFVQTCEAVGFIHERGYIHRDIKPSNVLVACGSEPRVKICDFGLARHHNTLFLTGQMKIMGSIGYLAPEVLAGRGDRDDPRQDVYSLGILLYALITGEEIPSLSSMQPEGVRERIVKLLAPYTHLPRPFADIVMRAVSEDPAGRYANVGALADDLRPLLPYLRQSQNVDVSPELVRFSELVLRDHSIVANASGALTVPFIHLTRHLIASNASVCVIDFRGDLIDSIADSVPRNMTNRVIYLDPADPEAAFGINPLGLIGEDNREEVLRRLAQAIALALDESLREGEQALLRNALQLLARLPVGTSIYALKALFTQRKYWAKTLATVAEIDRRLVLDFRRQWSATGVSKTLTTRLAESISRLFTHQLITGIVSQVRPKATTLMQHVFTTNKVGLLDFRSHQLTPRLYSFLLMLLLCDPALRARDNGDTLIIVNGAEQLTPGAWDSLVHVPAPIRVAFVFHESTPSTPADERMQRITYRRDAQPAGDRGDNTVMIDRAGEAPQVLDASALSLVFHSSWAMADFALIRRLCREAYGVARAALDEKLVRFADTEEPKDFRGAGIGKELEKLRQLGADDPAILLQLALIAFKTRYYTLGQAFLEPVIADPEQAFEGFSSGFHFHAQESMYDQAFQYVARAIEAASRQPSLPEPQRAALLKLVQRGFQVLMHEIKDVQAGNVPFLTALRDHFVGMPWTAPAFFVLRAQTRWFSDRTEAEADFERAVGEDESPHSINSYATWVKDIDGDLARAETLYRTGLKQFPVSALLLHNLALVLLQYVDDDGKRSAEAASLVSKAMKLSPGGRLRSEIESTIEALNLGKRGVAAARAPAATTGAPPRERSPVTAAARPNELLDGPGGDGGRRSAPAGEGGESRGGVWDPELARRLLTEAHSRLGSPKEVLAATLGYQLLFVDRDYKEKLAVPSLTGFLKRMLAPDGPIVELRDGGTVRMTAVFAGEHATPAPAGHPSSGHSVHTLVLAAHHSLGRPRDVLASTLGQTMRSIDPDFKQQLGGKTLGQALEDVLASGSFVVDLRYRGTPQLTVVFADGSPQDETNVAPTPPLVSEEAASDGPATPRLLRGVVKGTQPYGVFVQVEGGIGLVHVSEFPNTGAPERLKNDEYVWVRLLRHDPRGRMVLSFKHPEDDPWASVSERFPLDRVCEGRVLAMDHGGATVELAPDLLGRVNSADVSAGVALEVDQMLSVRVVEVDPLRRKIRLLA